MFNLSELRDGKIIKINARAEHHGDQEVPAVDVKIEMILPNSILTEFSRYLLNAMFSEDEYMTAAGQTQLDGLEPLSQYPHVRFPNLQPLRLNDEFIGYRLQILHGIEDDIYVDINGCEVKGFMADCKEGGYIVLTFRVTKSDVDELNLGRLGVLTGHDVRMRLLAPVALEDDPEDGEPVDPAEPDEVPIPGDDPGPDPFAEPTQEAA